MAETITTALFGQAATGAAAAAAASAGTAATAGLLGYGGSITLGGVLNTALALGSAGLSLGGGLAQSRAMQAQAQWQDFQAGQETLRGEQEANRVRETLLRTLASNNAGRAAAGVELSGSALDVDAEAAAAAERELSIVSGNAAARAGAARSSAQSARISGNAALLGGVGQAAGSLFNYASRVRRIG
jgi:hypothetical protein